MRTNTPLPDMSELIRIEALEAEQTFNRLKSHSLSQAEAIAEHYTKLAVSALQLRRMLAMRRYSGQTSAELDRCIELVKNDIVRYHRMDFGIELVW